jgi:hypothetical protein
VARKAEEAVLNDSERWSATLLFQETTQDGELETVVNSEDHGALISVDLKRPLGQPLNLVSLVYKDRHDPFHKHVIKSKAACRFIRDFVRRKALPVLEENRARRRRERDQDSMELAEMKRKYLP